MIQNKIKNMTDCISSARICIDVYNEGEMQGRLYHTYSEEPQKFHNVIDLLKLLGYIFDRYDFPQVSMKPRSYKLQQLPEEKYITEEENNPKPTQYSISTIRGKCATFWIKVLFRQNATWQGKIKWVEEGNEINFRSALEMIMLLDSCFCEAKVLESREDTIEGSIKENVI